jgi:tryptophanyl-tRNA synthetase
MGLLERAHSYKDKVAKGIPPGAGLFFYPVLMAADILIYRSNVVPVGQDQVQHIEMTRDMAGSFNQAYGRIFPLPEARLDRAPTVPGIDGKKMSKSYGNTIEIFAEGSALKNSVMKIVTDSTPVEAEKNPDNDNLFALFSLFASEPEKTELADRYRKGGLGYGEVKKMLLAKIDSHFAAARAKRKELERHPSLVEDALRKGAEKARTEARETMRLVREATGLR